MTTFLHETGEFLRVRGALGMPFEQHEAQIQCYTEPAWAQAPWSG